MSMLQYIDSARNWLEGLLNTKQPLTSPNNLQYNGDTMRVFVSCQIEEKEAVRKAYAAFANVGMTITHDWTRTDEIGDKHKNANEAGRRAKLDIDGVVDCDIYVLLSSNEKVGKGMYVELGAAIALSQTNRGPEVYVVGPMNHLSIFYLHPAVKHYDTVDELIFDLTSRGDSSAALTTADVGQS